MEKLIFSIGLILSGLVVGYALQFAHNSQILRLPCQISDLRKLLQKIGLLGFMPISFLGAVWVVSFGDMRVVLLPAVGVLVLLSGGGLGILAGKILKMPSKQMGVMYCAGSFTNIGAIGGLVCFMLLGEEGFALVALYKMFEEITYYTIGFPIARYYGGSEVAQGTLSNRIWKVVSDPFVATILAAFFTGLFLNLSGTVRPQFFEWLTALSVPVGTFILIVSIGLGMRFSSVQSHLKQCFSVSLIKFICMPIIGCSLAYFFNLHLVAEGLPFKVVAILSSMPVAFNALVAASIFELDLDLANSLWLVTTGMLLFILPWLYFLMMYL